VTVRVFFLVQFQVNNFD